MTGKGPTRVSEKILSKLFAQDSYRKAKEALAIGDYRSAILLSRLVLRTKPQNERARALLNAAMRKLEEQKIEAAWQTHERKIKKLKLAAISLGKLGTRRKKLILEMLGYWPLKKNE